jgi:hypothetical protein
MDPITTAIIAALTAGAAAGLTDIVKQAISDQYSQLKGLIQNKFGSDSQISKAIVNIEEKPDSAGRREMLQEEVASAKADQDPEIIKLAQQLIEHLNTQPGGGQFIQQASGSYIAQAGPGANASVNVIQGKAK